MTRGVVTDVSGRKFGRLSVVSRAGSRRGKGRSSALWLCICDCGKEKIAAGYALAGGAIRSCGCLRSEAAASNITKHHRRVAAFEATGEEVDVDPDALIADEFDM